MFCSEKGFHSGLGILFPPEDDDWWGGDFTHFNFQTTFKAIVKSVPKAMLQKTFEHVRWTIECQSEEEPVGWTESKVTFFSEFFVKFLQEEGKG